MRRLYHAGMTFLSRFLDILFPPRDTEALVRSATTDHVLSYLKPTVHTIDGHQFTTLLPYRSPLIRALVIEAKFKGDPHALQILGTILRTYLETHTDNVLVPIPLGRERLRERGYNQVEKIIVEAGAPFTHLLTRTKETLPQTELSGQARQKNMESAFTAAPCDPDRIYIVIDDVTTTGATLRDAARALTEAGAAHIELVALTH